MMGNIDTLQSSFITPFLCPSVQEQNVLEQESRAERPLLPLRPGNQQSLHKLQKVVYFFIFLFYFICSLFFAFFFINIDLFLKLF